MTEPRLTQVTYYERHIRVHKPYRFRSFLFDSIMTCLTGGFWLIRVFVRESRNR